MKRLQLVLFIFTIICSSLFSQPKTFDVDEVREIKFETDEFQIVGNLYLPGSDSNYKTIIWIHGSGPDTKTNMFPGVDFFNVFLEREYAVFRYDKPGSGDSKGELADSIIFQQRASIVNKAIDVLKKNQLVDSTHIGLVGSSQAGYVLPLVISNRDDISFMIGLSLPAQSGIAQWGYLLKSQMICEGYSEEKADEFSAKHVALMQSESKEEYFAYLEYFDENPIELTSLKIYDKNFAEKAKSWWPLNWNKAQRYDPSSLLKNIDIPALIIYGEKDTQVNPIQGTEIYRTSLETAGNPFYKIVTLPNADHNMSLAQTGCLNEQNNRGKWEIAAGLVKLTEKWLEDLNVYLGDEKKKNEKAVD